jgi:Histidine kinase
VPDLVADGMRTLGIRSVVASPIVVEGRLWGLACRDGGQQRREPGRAGCLAGADRGCADETRRRIERDLHDGTQQRLVSLGLELRLAQSLVPTGLPGLGTEIGRVADELNGVVEDLREIARGIHPAILSEGGLRLLGGADQRDQARARLGGRGGRGSLWRQALGGTFSVHSPAGHGTTVSCELPVPASR